MSLPTGGERWFPLLLKRAFLAGLGGSVFLQAGCGTSGGGGVGFYPGPPTEVRQGLRLPADGPRMLGQFPPDAPAVLAGSYILIEAHTGEPIAYKNADQIRPVASTQKLLAALVILEDGPLDQPVRIRPEDTRAPPSKMYLKAGDTYTRRQLLNVCLVKSANDAAEALARDIAGSVPLFCDRMNRKAWELGCSDSHFVNPHGLTAQGQYSTARDMARIAFHAYRNPIIRGMVRQAECTISTPRGTRSFESTNKLLKKMASCDGMKTGYTAAAGKCLVSSASENGRSVILVQLDSTKSRIFDDAKAIMRWGLHRSPGMNTSRLASNR